jgi:hypothetical protein
MIYTSNYARHKLNEHAIAISIGPPHWYTGKKCHQLAPTWEMVERFRSKLMGHTEYTKLYIQLLISRFDSPDDIVKLIPNGSFLICYETPGAFCHRRILADYIEIKTGKVWPEWMNEKELKQKRYNDNVDGLLEF